MKTIYEILAELLEYPNPASRLDSSRWIPDLSDVSNVTEFSLFTSAIEPLSINDLQELYTRTFDLNPVCALEIGYHLFGENYKRGVFLANLRETEAPFDLGQQNQLPDYLPVLLRLLTKLDDAELRNALISECITPALEKMLKTLGKTDNPYRHVLAAVYSLLSREVRPAPVREPRAHLPVIQNDNFSFGRSTDLL